MLIAPRYSGVDLPFYEPDSKVLYSKPQFIEAAESGETHFLRALLINRPLGVHNLAKLKAIAETEFEKLADYCGGIVVTHSWGLYNVPLEEHLQASPFLQHRGMWIPERHILVADVEIADVEIVDGEKVECDPLKASLWSGINSYLNARGKHKLSDQFPGQFLVTDTDGNNRPPCHVDIEPRFSY